MVSNPFPNRFVYNNNYCKSFGIGEASYKAIYDCIAHMFGM